MNRNLVIIVVVVGVVALGLVGGAAAWFLRAPATPSGELTAIPVSTTEVPTEAATEEATEAPAEGAVFEIVQAQSEARFRVHEILAGQDKEVIGITDLVAGQILVDPANLANLQMGPVTVGVRGLTTDSGNRNRAIQNFILQTDIYEFVTFTPKEFVGLPGSAAVGDTFSFQIIGDLTVKDITEEVTMDVTVTVDSDTQIHGLGSTTILRDDFGVGVIQTPPQVASIEDEVILELEFVAEAQ